MARTLNVILQRDVEQLGVVGDIVPVKLGYARNYLIPQKLALLASKRSVAELEHQKRITEHQKAKLKSESQGLAEKVNGLTLTIPAKAGEQDKLFGSVGTHDIAKALKDAGHSISHRAVKLEEPIKSLGKVPVKVRLQADVYAEINILVVPMSAEDMVEEIDDAEEAIMGVAADFLPLEY